MKVKGISIMLFSLVTLVISPVVSFATTNDEEKIKQESVEISSKIDKALDSVNKKYQEVETLKSEVSSTEQKIEETQKDITKTEASIEKRTESMGARMKNIQTNGSDVNYIGSLLEAESVSDFLSRAYAMTVLQGAEKSKVDSLEDDKERLEKLKTDLEDNKALLTKKQSAVSEETANLESGMSALKEELSNNQETLNKLANDRIAKEAAEQKAIADAKKAAEKEAKAKEEAASKVNKEESTKTTAVNNPTNESDSKEEPTSPTEPKETPGNSGSITGGKTMTMESTAYSYSESGASFYTATGIDLRQNSRVIAVDPSVIPLNSIVEVSGYGIAIAGDTGGAIKGNIIDVHFNTVDECLAWGRRSVTVTVQ